VGTEIERKFLVDPRKLPGVSNWLQEHIEQGFLSASPVVRVRLVNDTKGFLTIKGPGTKVRSEFEYAIPASDANELLGMCSRTLTKIRHYTTVGVVGGRNWEVDCFLGDLKGLWLAEVELEDPDDDIVTIPSWAGQEVTDDPRYANVNLVRYGRPTVGTSSGSSS